MQTTRIRAIAAVSATFVLLASSAFAQNDHLKCYKAKDSARVFRRASVDIEPFQVQFVSSDCQIKPKSKQVCVPSSKTVTDIVGGSDSPFAAQDLTDVQVCYKLKCELDTPATLQVTDQFGTREIEGFKAAKLCGPAIVQ